MWEYGQNITELKAKKKTNPQQLEVGERKKMERKGAQTPKQTDK